MLIDNYFSSSSAGVLKFIIKFNFISYDLIMALPLLENHLEYCFRQSTISQEECSIDVLCKYTMF